MTNYLGWTPPPGAHYVAPPVDNEIKVLGMYSDGSQDDEPVCAGDLNWSSYGDGPSIVAYAVVQEYKPAPEPKDHWAVGRHLYDTEADAVAFRQACADKHGPRHLETPIIHVREVLPAAREVVAWAVVDAEQGQSGIFSYEVTARAIQEGYGGTVVKLVGAMP